MALSSFGIFVALLMLYGGRAAPQPSRAMSMAAMPPMPGVCVEDGATGFVNETCQTDTDCYDSNAMTCINKKCQCAKNYVVDPTQSSSKQRVCAPVPSIFSSCWDSCQKPFECKSGQMMADGMMVAPMPPGATGKTCQCPGKSRYVNGYCDAGCKSDQRIGSKGECLARCSKDQVLIDGDCKKLADLGESCTDSVQCKAAYSSCQNGKCTCASGFSAQGGKCQATAYNCPFGDPLKKGNSVVLCDSSPAYPMCNGPMCAVAAMEKGPPPQAAAPMPAKMAAGSGAAASGVDTMPAFVRPYKTDSCPSSHYCYSYDYSGLQSKGHCCPRSTPKCPIGDAHPTAKCNGIGAQQCPYMTHNCLNVGGPGDYSSQLCCPKPCQSYDKVFAKDQCLPYAQYGDGCLYNEQCAQHNGVCSGGKCTCPSKAKVIEGMPKYCQLQCDSDEIQMGSECKARLKLGDTCTPENSFCPSGAYCNKKGVCSCLCGYQKINDKFCAPQPSCPVMAPNPTTPAPAMDMKKATFCKLDSNAKTPVAASDKCPGKSYCSYYVENMGVCCPQPDPFCPDGSKPNTSKTNCHLNMGACGGNEFCNVYFSSPIIDSKGMPAQGSVCCPSINAPMPMAVPMAAGGSTGVNAAAVAGSGPKGK